MDARVVLTAGVAIPAITEVVMVESGMLIGSTATMIAAGVFIGYSVSLGVSTSPG